MCYVQLLPVRYSNPLLFYEKKNSLRVCCGNSEGEVFIVSFCFLTLVVGLCHACSSAELVPGSSLVCLVRVSRALESAPRRRRYLSL